MMNLMKNRVHGWMLVAGVGATIFSGCDRKEQVEDTASPTGANGATSAIDAATGAGERYVANLQPLNAEYGGGASGEARLHMEGSDLVIEVDAQGLSPGIHLMHYHGFVAGDDATCAGAAQDANQDGVIDLVETESVSGTTLVPFHDHPASLEIPSQNYPEASDQGAMEYQQRVPLEDLERALSQTHGIENLSLDTRVVYIHGVPAETALPETAQSLPGVPAQVTLPIACGVLEPAG